MQVIWLFLVWYLCYKHWWQTSYLLSKTSPLSSAVPAAKSYVNCLPGLDIRRLWLAPINDEADFSLQKFVYICFIINLSVSVSPPTTDFESDATKLFCRNLQFWVTKSDLRWRKLLHGQNHSSLLYKSVNYINIYRIGHWWKLQSVHNFQQFEHKEEEEIFGLNRLTS
jgi:hypothetical protein